MGWRRGGDAVALVVGWMGGVCCWRRGYGLVLVDAGDGTVARRHAGLAAVAAGGGEGGVREMEMPGPKGIGDELGILIPTI